MFEKIVVVDSTGLNTWGVERLKELGKEVVFLYRHSENG